MPCHDSLQGKYYKKRKEKKKFAVHEEVYIVLDIQQFIFVYLVLKTE